MASIGLELPDHMKGPNFKKIGKVYPRIGSLLTPDGQDPKFLQLYFQGVIFPAGVQVFPAENLQDPQEILNKTLIIEQIL